MRPPAMIKIQSLLIPALAAFAFAATPAFAENCTNCPTCAKRADGLPHPVKVVNVTDLPMTFVKSTVFVELRLDAQGVPTAVRALGPVDRSVAARVVSAVSQWRFTPKQVDGVPVAGQFVLPLEITPADNV